MTISISFQTDKLFRRNDDKKTNVTKMIVRVPVVVFEPGTIENRLTHLVRIQICLNNNKIVIFWVQREIFLAGRPTFGYESIQSILKNMSSITFQRDIA